jgi:two-component system, OmpR family, response regulator MtrA
MTRLDDSQHALPSAPAAPWPERIAIIEDDEAVLESTVLLLERAGASVFGTSTGEQALALLREETVDVVVLDLMLPGMDGFEVCRQIRRWSAVPIVMLTARSGVQDVVLGLELGADDYVVKPFEGTELLARIRAVLRRVSPTAAMSRLRFGDLFVDAGAFRAELDGANLELTAMEFRLLVELVRHPGEVMTRERLLERVWGYDYLGDSRLVDMAIRRLRTKLGDGARDPEFIATVRGVGYRFDPPPR